VCIVESDVDVDGTIASRQLDLFTASDTYLRDGSFSIDNMLGFWTDAMDDAFSDDTFEFARNAGDVTGMGNVADEADQWPLTQCSAHERNSCRTSPAASATERAFKWKAHRAWEEQLARRGRLPTSGRAT
jgi:MEDS: MEthanogen/methylotroph, DcmR Sensory domain